MPLAVPAPPGMLPVGLPARLGSRSRAAPRSSAGGAVRRLQHYPPCCSTVPPASRADPPAISPLPSGRGRAGSGAVGCRSSSRSSLSSYSGDWEERSQRALKSYDKPEHDGALQSMYVGYGLLCGTERTFRFAVPLVLASVSDSFRPIALLGLIGQLAMLFIGPAMGSFLDRTDRVLGLNTVVLTQAAGIVMAGTGLAMMVASAPVPAAGHLPRSIGGLLRDPAFLIVVVGSIIDRLSALASDVATERDWIPLLIGSHRSKALAAGNAMFRRLDLVMECLGPLAFGIAFATWGAARALRVNMAVTLALMPMSVIFFLRASRLAPGALSRSADLPSASPGLTSTVAGLASPMGEEKDAAEVATAAAAVGQRSEGRATGLLWAMHKSLGFNNIRKGWKTYLSQPVLPASVAYFLLYFNTALSPGGIITAFLQHEGLSASWAAAFRSICALMGFFATYAGAKLIEKKGVVRAGGMALGFQATMLAGSMLLYYGFLAKAARGAAPLAAVAVRLALRSPTAFCAFVAVSRVGLWCFHLAETQLWQTTVEPSEAGAASTTELSLCSLAELAMLSLATIVEDPAHFGQLATVSAIAVFGALAVYSAWENELHPKKKARRGDKKDRRHFVSYQKKRTPPHE